MDIYEAMDPDVYFALFGDRIRHMDEAISLLEKQPDVAYAFPNYALLPGIKFPHGVFIACEPEVYPRIAEDVRRMYPDIEVEKMPLKFLKLIRRGLIDDRHFVEDKQMLGLSE